MNDENRATWFYTETKHEDGREAVDLGTIMHVCTDCIRWRVRATMRSYSLSFTVKQFLLDLPSLGFTTATKKSVHHSTVVEYFYEVDALKTESVWCSINTKQDSVLLYKAPPVDMFNPNHFLNEKKPEFLEISLFDKAIKYSIQVDMPMEEVDALKLCRQTPELLERMKDISLEYVTKVTKFDSGRMFAKLFEPIEPTSNLSIYRLYWRNSFNRLMELFGDLHFQKYAVTGELCETRMKKNIAISRSGC